MKKKLFVLSVFVFTAICSYSQKVALISNDNKKPILYTDSVTVNQISQGYFPIASENFDTLYANLKYLTTIMSERQRAKMQSFSLVSGSTTIEVERAPFAYGDRYTAVAISKIGNTIAKKELLNIKRNNKNNTKEIERLMKYIFSNNSYFKGPNEINPVLMNIVVIVEK